MRSVAARSSYSWLRLLNGERIGLVSMLTISSRGRSQVNRNTASATNTKNTEKMMPR